MRPALELALRTHAEESHLRQIVFITDGSVGNEAELYSLIEQQLGTARLFTVGIGSAPNSWFMRKSAELGRGTFVIISALHEVREKMDTLFKKLEHPQVTNIDVSWPGGNVVESYPAVVPDLYRGEPVTVKARAATIFRSGDVVRISGDSAAGAWSRELELAHKHDDDPGIGALWARAKIASLQRRRATRRRFRRDSPDDRANGDQASPRQQAHEPRRGRQDAGTAGGRPASQGTGTRTCCPTARAWTRSSDFPATATNAWLAAGAGPGSDSCCLVATWDRPASEETPCFGGLGQRGASPCPVYSVSASGSSAREPTSRRRPGSRRSSCRKPGIVPAKVNRESGALAMGRHLARREAVSRSVTTSTSSCSPAARAARWRSAPAT